MTTATLEAPTVMDKHTMETMARAAMNAHGLRHWKLHIGTARQQAGSCNGRTNTIMLSHLLMKGWPVEEVMDTILHEIAHALTPRDKGHGDKWRAKCVEIGAKPDRTYDGSLAREARAADPALMGKWLQSCECNDDRGRAHRRRKNTRWSACGHDVLYRLEGEPASAAKSFKEARKLMEGTYEWAKAYAVEIGATFSGGWVDAPKGYVWESSETHGIDLTSESYGAEWGQTAAEGRRMLINDLKSGFALCGCEETCQED